MQEEGVGCLHPVVTGLVQVCKMIDVPGCGCGGESGEGGGRGRGEREEEEGRERDGREEEREEKGEEIGWGRVRVKELVDTPGS